MLNKLIAIILSLSVLSVTGCAAMFNGTSQQVSIRSNNPTDKIYVNDAYIGTGNGITTFKKKKNYVIRVDNKKCESVSIPVSKSFDATTLLGVFIDFGIVSVLVVDGLGTGAWQEFDQTSYVVTSNCNT